jgi:hypothetical protein
MMNLDNEGRAYLSREHYQSRAYWEFMHPSAHSFFSHRTSIQYELKTTSNMETLAPNEAIITIIATLDGTVKVSEAALTIKDLRAKTIWIRDELEPQ